MFIEFDGILVNSELIKEIGLSNLYYVKTGADKYIAGYRIAMCSYNSDEVDYEWNFKVDEKDLAEKEFNKIKERLLGKDNS